MPLTHMAHTPHIPPTDPMSAFNTSAPPLPSETSGCAVGGGGPKNPWLHTSALAPATVAPAMSTGGSGISVDRTRVLGGGCIVDGRQGCMVDGRQGCMVDGTQGEVHVTQGEVHVEHLRQFLPPGAGGAGGREVEMSQHDLSSSVQHESVQVIRDVIYHSAARVISLPPPDVMYHSLPPPRSPPQPPHAYSRQEKEERGESCDRWSPINRGVRPESSCSSSVGSVYGAGNEPCTYDLDPRSDRSFSLLLFPSPITHTHRARDAGQQSVAGSSGIAGT